MNKLTNFTLKNCFKNFISKKEFNIELFNFIAAKYNIATRVLSLGRDQSWKEKLIKYLPNLENANCLDLACGTGDITFKLANKYKDAKIIGLDITPNMIEQAKSNNKFSNISFICQDMCNTDFKENYFDIITAGYALRNSPDLYKTLEEVKRILKSDGHIAILDFAKFESKFLQIIEYCILKFWGFICGLILHQNQNIYTYIAESLKYHVSQKKLIKLLKINGFEITKRKKFYFGVIELVIAKKISK